MPSNNMVLMTFGSWESTNLLNNQEEISASRLFLHIVCDSQQGGIKYGGSMEHSISPIAEGDEDESAENRAYPIFPGRFEADLNVPTGSSNPDGSPIYTRNLIAVENLHPTVNQDYTRVWYSSGQSGTVSNDDEVTDSLLEFYLQLDYPQNIVRGYIRIYKKPLFGGDSEVAVNLL